MTHGTEGQVSEARAGSVTSYAASRGSRSLKDTGRAPFRNMSAINRKRLIEGMRKAEGPVPLREKAETYWCDSFSRDSMLAAVFVDAAQADRNARRDFKRLYIEARNDKDLHQGVGVIRAVMLNAGYGKDELPDLKSARGDGAGSIEIRPASIMDEFTAVDYGDQTLFAVPANPVNAGNPVRSSHLAENASGEPARMTQAEAEDLISDLMPRIGKLKDDYDAMCARMNPILDKHGLTRATGPIRDAQAEASVLMTGYLGSIAFRKDFDTFHPIGSERARDVVYKDVKSRMVKAENQVRKANAAMDALQKPAVAEAAEPLPAGLTRKECRERLERKVQSWFNGIRGEGDYIRFTHVTKKMTYGGMPIVQMIVHFSAGRNGPLWSEENARDSVLAQAFEGFMERDREMSKCKYLAISGRHGNNGVTAEITAPCHDNPLFGTANLNEGISIRKRARPGSLAENLRSIESERARKRKFRQCIEGLDKQIASAGAPKVRGIRNPRLANGGLAEAAVSYGNAEREQKKWMKDYVEWIDGKVCGWFGSMGYDSAGSSQLEVKNYGTRPNAAPGREGEHVFRLGVSVAARSRSGAMESSFVEFVESELPRANATIDMLRSDPVLPDMTQMEARFHSVTDEESAKRIMSERLDESAHAHSREELRDAFKDGFNGTFWWKTESGRAKGTDDALVHAWRIGMSYRNLGRPSMPDDGKIDGLVAAGRFPQHHDHYVSALKVRDPGLNTPASRARLKELGLNSRGEPPNPIRTTLHPVSIDTETHRLPSPRARDSAPGPWETETEAPAPAPASVTEVPKVGGGHRNPRLARAA